MKGFVVRRSDRYDENHRFAVVLVALLAGLLCWQPAKAGTDTSRIVSIGGAVTEILYDLGQDKKIVGVDTTSLYPPRAAREKPSVGYMRQLSPEGVLGLRPSLIIAAEGAGPKETIAVLQAAKVPFRLVPDEFSGPGIVKKIHDVAGIVGAASRGECLARRVSADLDALSRIKASTNTTQRKRVLFVLSFVNGRTMVAGRGTAADGIIRMAGGVNAISEFEGYRPVSDEAIVAAKPDVVLTMQREGTVITADSLFAQAAFAATPAAGKRSFIAMEGLYLLGFGPRTARAARDLAVALYPQLTAQKLPSESPSALPQACTE